LSNTTRLPILILGLLIAASILAQDKPVEKSTTTPATPAVKSEPAIKAALAETTAPTPAVKVPAKPKPRFEFTLEERIRTENWDNIMDFDSVGNDKRGNERFRTKFTVNAAFNEFVDLNVRLGNEFRNYRQPETAFDYDEIFFDNLYLDFKKVFVPGVSLRIGRQDMVKGEGLLFSDPSGVDGSRSAYYNAFNLAYQAKKKKSRLELIGIFNPRRERFLPTIGMSQPVTWITVNPVGLPSYKDPSRGLSEVDQQSIGLYYTDRNAKDTDVEAYYFFTKQLNDARAVTAVNFIPNRHFSTTGFRVVHRLNKQRSFGTEWVLETGRQRAATVTKPAQDIRAWAGYVWVQQNWNVAYKPYVKVGYYALSGDDPTTGGTNESFDPMFARLVKFGELNYYAGSREKGLGYWQNMYTPQIEFGFTPWKPLTIKTMYEYLRAFHPYPGSATVFGKGVSRGNDISIRADVNIGKYAKSHIVYETQAPGDFYKNNARGWFLRAELMYTYKYSWLALGSKK
jgi:hypothetical protein